MNLKAIVWVKRALQTLLWGSVETCTEMFHQFLRASFAACLSACVFLAVSCRPHHDRLEDALRMAGDNRAELERVLHHYADDSLKLEAACFLIGNMPAHYSYEGALLDTLYAAFEQFHDSGAYDKKRFSCLRPFPYKKLSRVSDLTTVTADYLIENIEYSFKVWRERPWGKHIPFDRFCELILPYRIKDEPLTRWKKAFYEKYTPVLANRANELATERVSIAGKCCESGDLICVDALLPPARSGDILAVLSTGAYNYSMASNYNRNPIPPVVLVRGGEADYIVKPQTYDDIVRNDVIPDRLR